MDSVSYRTEGLPDVEAHAYVMVDSSTTMTLEEWKTQEPKHRRAAVMVQEILNAMDDPQYEYACLTVAFWTADSTGVKVLPVLDTHNPYEMKTYTDNKELDFWDPFSPQHRAQGMGGRTPVGEAIAWGRRRAEEWITASPGQVQRRAVIYLISDGMNNYGPNGIDEKHAIVALNNASEKGHIRLSTIGYFQSEPGTNQEEDDGRQLLQALPLNSKAYFEADNVDDIVRYVLSTITLAMSVS